MALLSSWNIFSPNDESNMCALWTVWKMIIVEFYNAQIIAVDSLVSFSLDLPVLSNGSFGV